MRLEDAIKKAEGKAEGYLASAFAVPKDSEISEWTLLFYNPDTKRVKDCFVSERFVTLGDESPSQGEMKPLDAGSVKITAESAIAAASKRFEKQIKTSLLSLHTEDKIIWTVSFIAPDFTVTRIDIDAQDGALVAKKEVSLIKRIDKK